MKSQKKSAVANRMGKLFVMNYTCSIRHNYLILLRRNLQVPNKHLQSLLKSPNFSHSHQHNHLVRQPLLIFAHL